MITAIMTGGYSCRQVGELGSRFIDGELSLAEWLRFRVHLLSCPPCREFIRQLGITVDALHNLSGGEGKDMRASLLETFEHWSSEDACHGEE